MKKNKIVPSTEEVLASCIRCFGGTKMMLELTGLLSLCLTNNKHISQTIAQLGRECASPKEVESKLYSAYKEKRESTDKSILDTWKTVCSSFVEKASKADKQRLIALLKFQDARNEESLYRGNERLRDSAEQDTSAPSKFSKWVKLTYGNFTFINSTLKELYYNEYWSYVDYWSLYPEEHSKKNNLKLYLNIKER